MAGPGAHMQSGVIGEHCLQLFLPGSRMAVPSKRDFSAHFARESLADRLRRLAALAEASGVEAADVYGVAPALQDFESNVAKLLGKEKAAFFATGTLAQRAALHSHMEQRANKADALSCTPPRTGQGGGGVAGVPAEGPGGQRVWGWGGDMYRGGDEPGCGRWLAGRIH